MLKNTVAVNKTLKFVWFYTFLALLALTRAVASYVFLVPNGFAPGGVSGIATIIYKLVQSAYPNLAETWFNPAVTVFVLNAPLLVIAFKYLDKKFAINTAFVVLTYSLFYGLFSLVKLPVFQATDYDSGIMFLAALTGGVLAGVGLGFMLRHNASLAGTDVVGKLIYKKNPAIDVQWAIFACDIVIVVLSGSLGLVGLTTDSGSTAILISILTPIFYSFISLFVTSEVAEVVVGGIAHSRVFNIITDRPDELGLAITKETHRGVTVVDAKGYFTGKEHKMLVTVIYKKQVNQVKRIIRTIDPNAFLFISKAVEVRGQGFSNMSEDNQ